MAETCVPLGCPEFVRLAKQNPCSGAPIPGTTNGAFFKCSRNVTLEARVQDAVVSDFVSDCGQVDEYTQDSYVQGYTLTFEIARFSPETQALLRGDVLLNNGTDNNGVIEVAVVGCATQSVIPSFIAELFYRVRACDTAAAINYLRVVIGGVRFAPQETDKEGQIVFGRWIGQSYPMRTQGLVEDGEAGPYDDFPAAVETDLLAVSDDQLYTKIWFTENNTTIGSFAVETDTCYTAEVPAFPVGP